jgi:hypothetical protein
MKIYLGIVGSKKVQTFAKEHGCGWCLTPDNSRDPMGQPYFIDNGAFSAWKNGTKFDSDPFFKLAKKYPDFDFAVWPDIVCGGAASLHYSYAMLKYRDEIAGPIYLAVQDGMSMKDVQTVIEPFDGLFVGGSISWKFNTARMWADLAHLHGKKCHAGRVGTWEGFVHMHFCGVDSVDTTTASRHQDDGHILKYRDHLVSQRTLEGATA